ADGSYRGTTISAYAEAGKVFEAYSMRIEPVLALSFAALQTDGYTERGTAGGNLLIVQGADHTSLKSMMGARVAYPFELESGRKIVPDARVMWGHEYMDDHGTFEAALSSAPGVPFTVRGKDFARDSLIAGAGITAPLSSDVVVYADYDVSLSPDQTVQSASVGMRMSW
ncbi:MAG: autotransporter outer membrane beta-barrel domain-containing protein, partial [Alphaproteobacteria bacterium]|nr:autotransporter outer membrane beta-barrel domain-containing protein [Alphaproteobacteria bacterium]